MAAIHAREKIADNSILVEKGLKMQNSRKNKVEQEYSQNAYFRHSAIHYLRQIIQLLYGLNSSQQDYKQLHVDTMLISMTTAINTQRETIKPDPFSN